MKLLRLFITGLPLFPESLELNFFARQRVDETHRDQLIPLSSKFYLNGANAIVGINASGKTSVLKAILLSLDILNNQPINHSDRRDILGDCTDATFVINFLSDNNEVCQLETHITSKRRVYSITSESLWTKPLSDVKTKAQLISFGASAPTAIRSNDEAFLPDDVSIIIAQNKKLGQHINTYDMLSFTNENVLPISDEVSEDIIQFLDPTIESLTFDRDTIHLKFKGQKEILLSDPVELNRYLSSGTIKGIVTFTLAMQALSTGGCLVIDELEDHFNKEIAATLMRFFMNASLNKNGGVLIFSTHYVELLDEFDRNDSIYITRNRNGLTVENLPAILKRNDIKKSDAYQSDLLKGTVPSYEAYLKLKKSIQAALTKEA